MRPEHRHELKTNELAEWLRNLPQWAKQNQKIIIYVSVIAVLVIGSALFHWYRKNVESAHKQLEFTNLVVQLPENKRQVLQTQQARGVDISYILIQAADNLRAAAKNIKDDRMAALALIKRAEALRAEPHYRQETISKQDMEAIISRAKTAYNEALLYASADPSLMAKAKFGLGLCEEELGNFEKARQIYLDVVANPDLEGTIAAAQAKLRLDTMADYQKKTVFKPAAKPTEPTQPPIKLGPIRSKPPSPNLPAVQTPNQVKVSDSNFSSQQEGKTGQR
jgi:hypothetical protein